MPSFLTKILHDYFRWVLLGIVVIVLAAGYSIFLNNEITTLNTISFSAQQKANRDLAAAKNQDAKLKQAIAKFQGSFSSADLTRLNKILPTQTDFPTLLLTVKQLATAAKLDLTALSVVESKSTASATSPTPSEGAAAPTVSPATPSSVVAYDVNVTVDGQLDYDQFKSFLTLVESSEPIFDLQNVTFSAASSDKATNQSAYSFILRTYVMPEDKEPAS